MNAVALLTRENADQVLDYEMSRNDLHARFFCRQPAIDPSRPGEECWGMVSIQGYNDHYFFAEVNRANYDPPMVCRKCGVEYVVRWVPGAVLVSAPLRSVKVAS